jgi:hypothetical protein
MDGRRVLLNFVPEEVEGIIEVLRHREVEREAAAGGLVEP